MEPSGRNRSQPVANGSAPKNGSNEPIGNRWQPTATVPARMVKVDLPLAKEGVILLAPQRETSPANPKARRTRHRD